MNIFKHNIWPIILALRADMRETETFMYLLQHENITSREERRRIRRRLIFVTEA